MAATHFRVKPISICDTIIPMSKAAANFREFWFRPVAMSMAIFVAAIKAKSSPTCIMPKMAFIHDCNRRPRDVCQNHLMMFVLMARRG